MGIGNILRNVRDRGLTDVLDPEVWKAYSEWEEIEKNGINLEADQIQSYCEQVLWRLSKCPECVEAGECVHCHCSMPEKSFTPLAKCSNKRWGKMLLAEDWEIFKKTNNIKIIII